MAKIDKQYQKLLRKILKKGVWYDDPNRKGVKRLQIPYYEFKHNLQKDGFPALTLKELYWRGVVGELLWFLRGDTNIKYLIDNNIHIWDKDAYNYFDKKAGKVFFLDEKDTLEGYIGRVKDNPHNEACGIKVGDLGRVYGAQWREWTNNYKKDYSSSIFFETIDQISNLIKNLKENPVSTQHIVTAWNPAELDNMALPPCHFGFQIMVYPLSFWERVDIVYKPSAISTSGDLSIVREELDKYNIPQYGFDLIWDQRSVDTFLGLPFNIASYALLAYIIGKIVNMKPMNIIGSLRNVHLYDNSLNAVYKLLERNVNKFNKCELGMNSGLDGLIYNFNNENKPAISSNNNSLDSLFETFRIKDFKLLDYNSYEPLKVEMLERD